MTAPVACSAPIFGHPHATFNRMNLRPFPDTTAIIQFQGNFIDRSARAGWGMSIAERIAWGLLSLIALIAWLRWCGPLQEDKDVERPQVSKRREGQAGNGQSIPRFINHSTLN